MGDSPLEDPSRAAAGGARPGARRQAGGPAREPGFPTDPGLRDRADGGAGEARGPLAPSGQGGGANRSDAALTGGNAARAASAARASDDSPSARSLRALLRGFGAWFKLELKAAAAFRAQIVMSLLGWVVPFAFMALWNTAAAGTDVMTPGQTTAYYLVMLVVTTLSRDGDLIFGMGRMVYTGELSTLLMMPFPPVLAVLGRPFATIIILAFPLAVVAPLLAWAMGAQFATGLGAVLAGLALGLIGALADMMTAAVFSLAALWFGKWDGIMGLYFGVGWVLGGLVAPSSFMPDWLAWAMRLSPVWARQGGCAELLSGALAPKWWMFAVAATWVGVMALAWRRLWPRAMRRFEAVGL
ncbi:MAG: ABC-2 family transporter protein [Bifidobacteriaceae bacterium]|nr:ABC-2 family transporter protein [Bifidobacteriaceae bacterium]